jgi:hypothetical protein
MELTKRRDKDKIIRDPKRDVQYRKPKKTVDLKVAGELSHLMRKHVSKDESSVILKVNNRQYIYELKGEVKNIMNLYKINDIRMVNKFFEAVNHRLPYNGIFIGCVETKGERKKRILNKFPKVIGYPYYTLDFIVKRILPKTKLTRKLYFSLTKGRNRVMTMVEALGRLKSCGFVILETIELNNLLYFVAKKMKEPSFDPEPTYSLLARIKRFGKNGKLFNVYKFRTMHPYAEYLQEYMFRNNNLKEGGKIKNDIRITSWGRIMRKFWIDELPMIMNVVKGDMRIIGVRPLSRQYFNLYREDLKTKRMKYKPGLIPPFYADMPKTLEEIMDSEERYLDAFEKSPIKTDWIYFRKAMYNIFVKKARSS